MTVQLGQIAPDFEQESSQGKIKFYDYLGNSWGILFSQVCTTELAEVSRLKPEWEKRNVKPLGLSVDAG
jgi:alkyl hydroperoxide reductase subunit AhpC